MTAFEQWFRVMYLKDIKNGIMYLKHCIKFGQPDSVIWDYLKATGDKIFDDETFKKAAENIIENGRRE